MSSTVKTALFTVGGLAIGNLVSTAKIGVPGVDISQGLLGGAGIGLALSQEKKLTAGQGLFSVVTGVVGSWAGLAAGIMLSNALTSTFGIQAGEFGKLIQTISVAGGTAIGGYAGAEGGLALTRDR